MNPEKMFDFYGRNLDPKKLPKDESEDIIVENENPDEKVIGTEDVYLALKNLDNHGEKFSSKISMVKENIEKYKEEENEKEENEEKM